MSRTISLSLLSIATAGAFYLLVDWLITPVALDLSGRSSGVFRIADFLYQIHLTEAYWSGLIDTPYAQQDQARVLEVYFDSGGGVAMAHGMSPVVLVLWYPLAFMTRTHPAVVYSLWVSICFTVFTFSLVKAYSCIESGRRDLRVFFIAASLAVVASRVGWRAFAVGQSAPMAAAGLVLLATHLLSRDSAGRSAGASYGVLLVSYLLVLWKVHYIALAGGIHLMLGEPRRALQFSTGAVFVAVGIPSVFDPRLFTSWFEQISHFAGQGFSSEYVQVGQATAGGSGITLRRVLRDVVPVRVADVLGWVSFAGAMLVLVVARLRSGWEGTREGGISKVGVGGRRTMAIGFVVTVLLLLPYLGRYDDLFLVVPVTLVVLAGSAPSSRMLAGLTVLALVLACWSPAPDIGGSAAAVLVAKGAALVLLILLSRPKSGAVVASGA